MIEPRMTPHEYGLKIEVNDIGDDDHREVILSTDAWVSGDDEPDDATWRALVLARRQAANLCGRIGLELLPEVADTRANHGCHGSRGLEFIRFDSGRRLAPADGCSLNSSETINPVTGDPGDTPALWLIVPTAEAKRYVKRIGELLAAIAADDAAIPPPTPAPQAALNSLRGGLPTTPPAHPTPSKETRP
ncbi:hypothetical protein Xcel_2069 [Xylanimonas cellulosilytica DSM 15894]|uniref:Uncharacterized protein n=1 Tax=Xylanimonas cellulosilytica (strain DSM 15894 / JCM 12276 / CECT 5975 / KCTC 9989 / LMG 20990 / NBRC 107835 / XIL07) TaxID=446471 RepID=D1BU74_XYLCX|nr:hypothetical protein [Xylanimonas cellulosilytica]ACZ31087.1 hypothetical protein Xcel_2069 [Xylanimonas cellulosilytica DSM 15894]